MESSLYSTGVAMESLLGSAMEGLLTEISISVIKSLACLLFVVGSRTSGITIKFPKEPRQLERLSKADLYMEKQPDPEMKDATETEDDDEDNDDGKNDEDDGGSEDEDDFSGGEEDGEDDGDTEDEPEANSDGGSGDDDDEGDNDDEDGEEEEEEEDEETLQPPAKKRK